MQDYEGRKQLEDGHLVLHGFPHHQAGLNECQRASLSGWCKNLKQSRDYSAVIDNQFLMRANGADVKGLEAVKQRLASSSVQVRITALKEALQYGKEGFKLVAKIIKTERNLVQLNAIDLLWEKTNSRGKKTLLKYLLKHPDVCTNYIEKILEPSLSVMQEEQEKRRQVLTQVCNTQEFIRQQYKQALKRVSLGEKSDRQRSIPIVQTNWVGSKRDKPPITELEPTLPPTKTPVAAAVRDNPAQLESTSSKSIVNEAIALKAQLDQQTALVNHLLPDLVLISKLFEAKAKKHLVEAQVFPKAIQQIEKSLLEIEAQWQDLEYVKGWEKSPLKLLGHLESLISQMQEQLMLLHQTVARAVSTQLQIQHHYNLAKQGANYCQYRAQLDWQQGNENWARETLVRRKTYKDTATLLKASLEQQTPQLETFKCHLFVLQTWLFLAKQIKTTLKSDRNSASAQNTRMMLCKRIKFPYNLSSIMTELECIKQEYLGDQLP